MTWLIILGVVTIIFKNIAPYVHHLYINSVANKALVQNYNDSEYFNLFTKRKLFSRMDFQDFILRESVLLLTKERYYIDDLHEDTREVLSGLVEKSDEKQMFQGCLKPL